MPPRQSCWNFCGKYGIDLIVASGSWTAPSDAIDSVNNVRTAVVTTAIPRLKKADMNGMDHINVSFMMIMDTSTCNLRQDRTESDNIKDERCLHSLSRYISCVSLSLSPFMNQLNIQTSDLQVFRSG